MSRWRWAGLRACRSSTSSEARRCGDGCRRRRLRPAAAGRDRADGCAPCRVGVGHRLSDDFRLQRRGGFPRDGRAERRKRTEGAVSGDGRQARDHTPRTHRAPGRTSRRQGHRSPQRGACLRDGSGGAAAAPKAERVGGWFPRRNGYRNGSARRGRNPGPDGGELRRPMLSIAVERAPPTNDKLTLCTRSREPPRRKTPSPTLAR